MGDAPTTICKRAERIGGEALNLSTRIAAEGLTFSNHEDLLGMLKRIRDEANAIGRHFDTFAMSDTSPIPNPGSAAPIVGVDLGHVPLKFVPASQPQPQPLGPTPHA